MAKRSKTSTTKKIVTVSLVLIGVQVVILLFLSEGDGPKTEREAIERAVASQPGLSGSRAVQAKLQAAIMDFRLKNGKFPTALTQLVPKYFDSVPANPDTNEQFAYRVDGQRFVLGEETPTMVAANGATGSTPAEMVQQLSPDQQKALIGALDATTRASYVYDPSGKRDPFSPFELTKKRAAADTPLEMYTFSELKVTAILNGIEPPKAIVEDSTGHGFTVSKGTKIGPNGGEVAEILADKVMVLESEVDISGTRKTRTIEMPLRTQ